MNHKAHVKALTEELNAEREAREIVELEAQAWRTKAIDDKIKSLRAQRELLNGQCWRDGGVHSSTILRDSQISDTAMTLEQENARLHRERDELLTVLESLRMAASDHAENDTNDGAEGDADALEKERRSRRVAEAITRSLRNQVSDAEARAAAAESEEQTLRTDLARMRTLLQAAEEVILHHEALQKRAAGINSEEQDTATAP